ncbi:MAG: tungstate ABC transporter substrate-binding protein WtpA [Pseudomonadota bacterium]
MTPQRFLEVPIIFLVIVLPFSFGCTSAKNKEQLIIFHAGSLSVPLKDMAEAFQKKYPNIEVIREASGSVTAARKITDLHKKADVMASADYTVIENLLMPKYTDFYAKFATNEMAIMYTDKSKYNDEINAQNWPEILLREGVSYGHSDPNTDPCGYRSQLVWQLAEKYYKKPGLYESLRKSCPRKNIRPKETDLLALLETGELDYVFIYHSVAEQHHGKSVILPDEINLKSSDHADFYKTASIKIAGEKPGETITQTGEPMVYGITVLKDAPNYKTAIKFVEFVLGPEGRTIMTQNGQPPVVPAQTVGKVPDKLKVLARK